MRRSILMLLLLSNLLFLSNEATTCEGETIDQCTACDTGEDSDSCSKCEPGYFPFLGNYFCLACNDSTFGQKGCIGNCDGTNFTTNKYAYCEEDGCAEGYAYHDGVCYNCAQKITGCSKCIYKVPEYPTYGNFTCLECRSNQFKLQYDECEPCEMDGCDLCHYNENYTEKICDKCDEIHYFNEEGKCQPCKKEYIKGGTCYICSENGTEYDYCLCNYNYVKAGDFECIPCPHACSYGCSYNNETTETECKLCSVNYALNADKKCVRCGENCGSCSFDEKDNLVCRSCMYPYTLYNGTCIKCESGCSKCTLNETSEYKNETICSECSSVYALLHEGKCINCDDDETAGDGCEECSYDEKNKKYICNGCWDDYYSYVNNTHKCISNLNKNEINLYGCSLAQYDETNDIYECFSCKSSFLFISKDKTCRNPREIGLSNSCRKIENLGTIDNPKYSCVSCQSDMVYVANESAGIYDCFVKRDNFQYCLEGVIGSNGEY